jgi:hypothetical protein
LRIKVAAEEDYSHIQADAASTELQQQDGQAQIEAHVEVHKTQGDRFVRHSALFAGRLGGRGRGHSTAQHRSPGKSIHSIDIDSVGAGVGASTDDAEDVARDEEHTFDATEGEKQERSVESVMQMAMMSAVRRPGGILQPVGGRGRGRGDNRPLVFPGQR